MNIEIITPDKTVFEGKVSSVQIPGRKGSFQVLTDHAPIISTLEKGPVTLYMNDGTEKTYMADGGVVELRKNTIVLLVERILE